MQVPSPGAPAAAVAPASPRLTAHPGRWVRLEPLRPEDAGALWPAAAEQPASFDYLRYGPFGDEADLRRQLQTMAGKPDQPFFSVIPEAGGRPEGWLSYCDISTRDAALEIGSLWFSPRLQRTRASTEAVYLLMRHAFDLGYHRIAWRCDVRNAASLRAAGRLGFTPEGVWRQAEIVKGRRRDTAWHGLLAGDWPPIQAAFEAWLDPSNFDEAGRAIRSLSGMTAACR